LLFTVCITLSTSTDMRRLTTGIRYVKCVVRRFRRCANVIECTYRFLCIIAYYTHRLYGKSLLLLCYKPVEHVTVLNTVGNCNTMVLQYNSILYYNIIILWDHRRICGPSLAETSLCGAYLYYTVTCTTNAIWFAFLELCFPCWL